VELACSTKPMLPPGCREKNRPPLTVSGLATSYAFAAARLAKPRTADMGIARPGLLVRMPATMVCRDVTHRSPQSDSQAASFNTISR